MLGIICPTTESETATIPNRKFSSCSLLITQILSLYIHPNIKIAPTTKNVEEKEPFSNERMVGLERELAFYSFNKFYHFFYCSSDRTRSSATSSLPFLIAVIIFLLFRFKNYFFRIYRLMQFSKWKFHRNEVIYSHNLMIFSVFICP